MADYKTYQKGEYKDSDELTNAKQQNSHWGSQQLKDFHFDDHTDSDRTNQYQSALDGLKGPGDFSFSKQQGWDDIYNQITNRQPFNYDVNGDALYQQYKDQYINQGKMAMMDTMGQAAAMTGGYGNSNAQAVGQQVYQGYLQQLTDKVPELYQLALNKYNSDGDELYKQHALYADLYNTEYGQHRDAVGDYQTDRNYLANQLAWSSADDREDYNTRFNKALTENESYNSNVTSNRNYWSGQVSDTANREWGQYTDNESITAKAIEMANDNLYKQEQVRIADAELDYQKSQDTLADQVAALTNKYVVDDEKVGKVIAKIGSEEDFEKKYFNSKDAKLKAKDPHAPAVKPYRVNGKTFDSYEDYVKYVIDSDEDLTRAEVGALIVHYGLK